MAARAGLSPSILVLGACANIMVTATAIPPHSMNDRKPCQELFRIEDYQHSTSMIQQDHVKREVATN